RHRLKTIYNRIKGPSHTIDNVLKIHSLRPHTLAGHMTLYKSVLPIQELHGLNGFYWPFSQRK
ncbi:MAG: hypothetical protein AAFZ89_14080, partial [Bacteroidota bacterium]